jgi:hypothetical protein
MLETPQNRKFTLKIHYTFKLLEFFKRLHHYMALFPTNHKVIKNITPNDSLKI